MLDELETFKLDVILVPARYPKHVLHMVRVAVCKNPPWYSEFCGRYASTRKRKKFAFDTRIKRLNTLRVLKNLIQKGCSSSVYAHDLLATANERKNRANRKNFSQNKITTKKRLQYCDGPF